MTVCITVGTRQRLVGPDEVDRALDEIEAGLVEPTLIRLAAGSTIMHIGLGHPAGAVALLLDDDGICWCSDGTDDGCHVSYRNGNRQHHFNSRATISRRQARAAVVEFVQTHHRPAAIPWLREPS